MDPIVSGPDADARPSGSLLAVLRKQIADGLYPAGARMTEEAVAQQLGVSRTPVRLAFRTLAQEGLLQVAGKRGFVVRAFSADDVLAGVEVRGALEGIAARRLAQRGLDDACRAALQACLADGDAVLARGRLDPDDIGRWSALNARFHGCIVQACGSAVIAEALARNDHLPFASADSIVAQPDALGDAYERLRIAQWQHRCVVEALEGGESARVEALMREHALIGVRHGGVVAAG
jgi:GntR family transcriptional regulator of vanillate catabolism